MPHLICKKCGKIWSLSEPVWRCECGGPLDIIFDNNELSSLFFDKNNIANREKTLWRYRELIPVNFQKRISFNEGFTPLVHDIFSEYPNLCLKLDYLMPTGSFKDRGATVLISKVNEWGISEVVEDSSGNAGSSIAAYSALAGIKASIYIPYYASKGKISQIKAYGANLITINGTRSDVNAAVLEAAKEKYYASHLWNPFFIEGLKTVAFELVEQLNWDVPDSLIIPIGSGGLFLGVYKGFLELLKLELIKNIPRFFGVQSPACPPIYNAFLKHELEPVPCEISGETKAEGILIAKPPRGRDILEVLYKTKGAVTLVSDSEIEIAYQKLAKKGIFVEHTSATVLAALKHFLDSGLIDKTERVVAILTGTGLKEYA